MNKTISQEPICARLEITEDGIKVLCCGVSGCKETLATILAPRPTTVHCISKDGTPKGIKREQEESHVEVARRYQQMDAGLWADPDGAGVLPALKSRYLANKRAEKLRLREARARRWEQAGKPTALGAQRQWSGIKAGRPQRAYEQADLDTRPLLIICPTHGTRNKVESVM